MTLEHLEQFARKMLDLHRARMDAHELRIVKLESRTAASEGRLDGMADGIILRFEELERRIELVERKLSHKTREAE